MRADFSANTAPRYYRVSDKRWRPDRLYSPLLTGLGTRAAAVQRRVGCTLDERLSPGVESVSLGPHATLAPPFVQILLPLGPQTRPVVALLLKALLSPVLSVVLLATSVPPT